MDQSDLIISVELDQKTVTHRGPDIEQERKIAIYDLLEENFFRLREDDVRCGPYALILSIEDNRLIFHLSCEADNWKANIELSLTPFRRIVKDYWVICENYFKAIRQATPSQIETIDMARRSVHNEGSTILSERLKEKVDMDEKTARRLFTLLCVLHLR